MIVLKNQFQNQDLPEAVFNPELHRISAEEFVVSRWYNKSNTKAELKPTALPITSPSSKKPKVLLQKYQRDSTKHY